MVSRYRIVVPGPLEEFAGGLRRDLAGQGYALDTVTDHVHRLADLSGWLGGCGLAAADLTGEVAGRFLAERRAAGYRSGASARAFAPVLGYLREIGAAPAAARPAAVTALDVLLAAYQRYLEAERSLSVSTVRHYLRYARWFLAGLPGPLDQVLAGLSAGQVTGYVLERARRRRGRAQQDMVVLPALRSLLRYLHTAGYTGLPLAGAVPAGRSWKPGLPRAASADDLSAVLTACDRASAGGRRDYAIVLAMSRLALRGGEVARLRLADVAWRSGELRIAGKGGRTDILPLPADVGQAMADYLLHGRPATVSPNLFVTVKAPFGPLAVSSVTQVVARACGRAGVPRFGPHRIRHAAACGLLAAGAPMEEISQLLRHAPAADHGDLRQGRSGPAGRPGRALPDGSRAMSLTGHVDDYLEARRSLGYKLRGEGRMLAGFAARLEEEGHSTITIASALAWATESQDAAPAQWRRRLSVVRGFARYLASLDPACQIPPADLLTAPAHRPPPYIYSAEEISALIHAAGTIGAPLPAATMQALISLIAATGMFSWGAKRICRAFSCFGCSGPWPVSRWSATGVVEQQACARARRGSWRCGRVSAGVRWR